MIYYENINIDITTDSIKLTYISLDKTPLPGKQPKTGFLVTRSEDQSEEDFKKDAFKLLHEALNDIENNNFKEKIKTRI